MEVQKHCIVVKIMKMFFSLHYTSVIFFIYYYFYFF